MAHKKAGGSSRINKDSISKRLGVKLYGGQAAKPGNIIIRQRGNRVYPGSGTKQGRDFTIFASVEGTVNFLKKLGKTLVVVK